MEIAYHDNLEDAQWITENLPAIASNLAVSLTQYFNLPFIVPGPEWWGTVAISSGALNIRSRPDLTSSVITRAYKGDKVKVLGHWNGWYSVDYNGTLGYASARYIR